MSDNIGNYVVVKGGWADEHPSGPEGREVSEVWVVEPVGYDEYGIMGLFESLDAAKARYRYAGEWKACDDGTWETVDADACSSHGYSIYRCEVQA